MQIPNPRLKYRLCPRVHLGEGRDAAMIGVDSAASRRMGVHCVDRYTPCPKGSCPVAQTSPYLQQWCPLCQRVQCPPESRSTDCGGVIRRV